MKGLVILVVMFFMACLPELHTWGAVDTQEILSLLELMHVKSSNGIMLLYAPHPKREQQFKNS